MKDLRDQELVDVEDLPDPEPVTVEERIAALERRVEELHQQYVDLSHAHQSMLNRWINQR